MASSHAQQQQERERILRIGIILGGKIIEERLIRDRVTVMIGQSAKNTFAVPIEGLPRSWPLFSIQNDRYRLHFTEKMDGRISEGTDVQTLNSLKGTQAVRNGDAWVMPLSDHARGKIVVGEMTLLFQFVTEPPRQPRPHLPASVRGTFTDRIDPVLAIVMAISLLIHFSLALYAYQRDRVVRKRSALIFNETFQRPVIAQIELPDLVPPKEEASEQSTEAKSAENPADSKSKPPKAEAGGNKRDDGRDKASGDAGSRSAEESLRLQEEAIRYANNLLSDDFSERGIGGGSSDRDPKNDLGEAIADIKRSGAKVEVGGGSSRGTRGDGSTRIGTGQGPDVEGPGETTTRTEEKVKEKVPETRVNLGGGVSDDDTSLSPDAVLRKIRTAYMSGLKRCHKDVLKRDPTAGGTVTLRFTVGESGRVVRVTADGFDSSVDQCIEARARSWRFGIPKDSDGEPTDATFKISLVLQPE